MEQIPVEVLEMIFDRLPIGQLDECRRVCKSWQFTIDCLMRFDCLVVYRDFLPVNQTLFPTNERLSLRYCIHSDAFSEPSEFKKAIYRKFKRIWFHHLFITHNFKRTSRFHSRIRYRNTYPHAYLVRGDIAPAVNWLEQLEELHLEISVSPCRLTLPNLKTFRQAIKFPHDEITLDAPQLVNLCAKPGIITRLVHPQTIETLEIHPASGSVFYQRDFCEFLIRLTGLKRLLIKDNANFNPELFENYGVIQFLRDRLNEVHLFGTIWSWKMKGEFLEAMKALKDQTERVKIYYNGLEISSFGGWLDGPNEKALEKHLCEFALKTSDQLDFYLSNASAVCETELPLYQVDYSLIEQGGGRALTLFSVGRLTRLERIVVSRRVKDELQFGRWLSGSATLIEIVFGQPLSQDFYSNTLPSVCPTLQCLAFTFDAPLDFAFLLKFKFLYRVDLSSRDYRFGGLLFSRLAYLRCVVFYERNGEIRKRSLGVIKKDKTFGEEHEFEIYNDQERKPAYSSAVEPWLFSPVKLFDNLESLVDFLEQFIGF